MKNQRGSCVAPALDGCIALCIASCILQPGLIQVNAFFRPWQHMLRLTDAMFVLCFVIAWQYCFTLLHLYDRFAVIHSRLRAIARGVLIMMAPLGVYVFFMHRELFSIPRLAAATLCLFSYVIDRIIVSSYFARRSAAKDPKRVLILGSGPRASKAWREIRTRYRGYVNMLGFVDTRDRSEMPPDVAKRHISSVEDLEDLFLAHVVDVLLVAMPVGSCYAITQAAIDKANAAGVDVIYLHDIYTTRKNERRVHDTVFQELLPRAESYILRTVVKRSLDIILCLIGLVILSPILLAIAIGIKLTSRGPVIFTQERFGHRRRLFSMYKFRSMVHNAEDLLPALEARNELDGPIFKLTDDPRVTPFGKFLRRTSLDELPQLVNVLLGNMSLVGPRPMSQRDVSLFSEAALFRRFSVRPGITGLWQVNGRSSVGFDHWIKFDNNYIDRWSLFLDLKIIAQTFAVVFARTGAV